MRIKEKLYYIQSFTKSDNYIAYSITATFLHTAKTLELGDQLFYNEYLSFYDNKSDRILTSYTRLIEDSFRLALNKVTIDIIKSRNPTRKSHFNKQPITFYDFQVAKKNIREKAIEDKPSFSNVSPLHIHGIILVPRISDERFQFWMGQNTILHFFNKLGQSSEIKPCYEPEGWFRYSTRDYFSPLPREGVHPSQFSLDPMSFCRTSQPLAGVASTQ